MRTDSLGARLRKLREAAGLGVREAAAKLGKTAGYLSRVEVRGELPSFELICEMAALYGANAAALLELAKEQQVSNFRSQVETRQKETLRLFRKKGSSQNERTKPSD